MKHDQAFSVCDVSSQGSLHSLPVLPKTRRKRRSVGHDKLMRELQAKFDLEKAQSSRSTFQEPRHNIPSLNNVHSLETEFTTEKTSDPELQRSFKSIDNSATSNFASAAPERSQNQALQPQPRTIVLTELTGVLSCLNYLVLTSDRSTFFQNNDETTLNFISAYNGNTAANPLVYIGCPADLEK